MITRRTALARARRGAKFLDGKRPRWRRKINTEHLNMASGRYERDQPWSGCILAQVGATKSNPGEYVDTARSLGIDPAGHEAEMLGFLLNQDGVEDYPTLTSAWLEVLEETMEVSR